jgi:tRNA pseudouridine55 synthase
LAAINKPSGVTSAGLLRDLQPHLNHSKLFAPWLAAEVEKRKKDAKKLWGKTRHRKLEEIERGIPVKMGHGGTLDPLATGVLIVGVGSGTKELPGFLGCEKGYDAVCLFGAATDTYDVEGKVAGKKHFQQIHEDLVVQTLPYFRGKLMQVPPVFSALRVNGKRLYEYAREGLEIPKIEAREVEVKRMELLDWWKGGEHSYKWPSQELDKEEKAVAEKMMNAAEESEEIKIAKEKVVKKRKRDHADEEESSAEVKPEDSKGEHDDTSMDRPLSAEPDPKKVKTGSEAVMSGALPVDPDEQSKSVDPTSSPKESNQPPPSVEDTTDTIAKPPSPSSGTSTLQPPAIRLRMTVTSGFYVRSLCHDLGRALGSYGLMAALTRTKQGDFELGKNVIEWDDFAKGEEVWGPKVRRSLENWMTKKGTLKLKGEQKRDGKGDVKGEVKGEAKGESKGKAKAEGNETVEEKS